MELPQARIARGQVLQSQGQRRLKRPGMFDFPELQAERLVRQRSIKRSSEYVRNFTTGSSD